MSDANRLKIAQLLQMNKELLDDNEKLQEQKEQHYKLREEMRHAKEQQEIDFEKKIADLKGEHCLKDQQQRNMIFQGRIKIERLEDEKAKLKEQLEDKEDEADL